MLPVFCIRFYSPLLLTISTLAVHRWLTLLKDAEKRWMTLAEASNVISDHLCVCVRVCLMHNFATNVMEIVDEKKTDVQDYSC